MFYCFDFLKLVRKWNTERETRFIDFDYVGSCCCYLGIEFDLLCRSGKYNSQRRLYPNIGDANGRKSTNRREREEFFQLCREKVLFCLRRN